MHQDFLILARKFGTEDRLVIGKAAVTMTEGCVINNRRRGPGYFLQFPYDKTAEALIEDLKDQLPWYARGWTGRAWWISLPYLGPVLDILAGWYDPAWQEKLDQMRALPAIEAFEVLETS